MTQTVSNLEKRILSFDRTRVTVFYSLLIVFTLVWTYGEILGELAHRWWDSPDYVHGFLVIPFAIYLAWRRRELKPDSLQQGQVTAGYVLAGCALILCSIVMRCFSAYMSDPMLGPLSLPICVAGVVLLLGGGSTFAWLWPSIIVLPFMIPLPDFMASWGNLALQRVATVASTFLLQTFGVPAASFGNVIVLTNTELGVEEACSGLRSTVLFLAVSVGSALLLKGIPERTVAILCAAPAAIIANIIRIVSTGILYQYASSELAEAVFHDLFGFLMLPLAAGMVWIAVTVTRSVLPADEDQPLWIGTVAT